MRTKTNTLIILLAALLISTPSFAKLYKWVDANGKISFSDKVPPSESRREREELNEHGRTIAIKDAAKTPEQIEQYKKIVALQKTQEKLLKAQLAKDNALLKTFQSEQDIDTLANSKFEMIKSHITIAQGQSDTLKKQLLLHQKAAANFERAGEKIPAKNVSNIESAQSQFDKNQREIDQFNQQQVDLSEQLVNDKTRFKILKSQPSATANIHSDTIPSLELGELPCNANNCDALWEKAQGFIAQQGAPILFTSESLALTKKPTLSKNRGLSLTKLKSDEQTIITLDIRCADSKGGKETCKNEETTRLIKSFNQLGD